MVHASSRKAGGRGSTLDAGAIVHDVLGILIAVVEQQLFADVNLPFGNEQNGEGAVVEALRRRFEVRVALTMVNEPTYRLVFGRSVDGVFDAIEHEVQSIAVQKVGLQQLATTAPFAIFPTAKTPRPTLAV
uniref:Uncharacterized protein n=1 Tax=Romanomermis culicivorax TaxID=13658 RepID=A0A915KI01_ROMCU